MKSVAMTAFVALILTLPLMFRKRKVALQPLREMDTQGSVDENRRYDVDDLLT